MTKSLKKNYENHKKDNNLVLLALKYANLGLKIIPVHTPQSDGSCSCGKQKCTSSGKHPRLFEWQLKATTDSDTIKNWWGKYPDANIGIATGKESGVFVFDIDGSEGAKALKAYENEYEPLPKTPTQTSGSGGKHYFFKYPENENVGNHIGLKKEKLDIRGDNGQVLAHPSKHLSGNCYEWDKDLSPFEIEFSEAPSWLLDLIKDNEQKFLNLEEYVIIPQGQRRNVFFNLASSLRGKGLGLEEIFATLEEVNRQRCQPALTNKEMEGLATSVSEKYKNGDLLKNMVVHATMTSSPELEKYNIVHAPHKETADRPNYLAMQLLSEYMVISDIYKNTYFFKEPIWKQIADPLLESLVLRYDLVTKANNSRCLEAVAFIKRYSIRPEIPWNNLEKNEIGLQNGILNLDTDQLRPALPEDYLEYVIPHSYNPKAQCPSFDNFLTNTFKKTKDPENNIDAIWEFIGYILMPRTPYKKALLIVGPPDTGKTTIENVLIHLVGRDSICHISIDEMGNASARAPIKGKALNIIGEIKANSLLDDAGFKQLVSIGEPIQLNEKYEKRESYIPFAKHVFLTNNLPDISDRTNAVFNRLLMVPFNNPVPIEKRIRDLDAKFYGEIEGIVAKAVKYLKKLRENNGIFTESDDCKQMLEDYKREQNPMHEFIEECLVFDEEGYTEMKFVRAALKHHMSRTKGWSGKKITQLLREAKCEIKQTSKKGKVGKYLLQYNLSLDTYTALTKYGSEPIPNTGTPPRPEIF